MEADDGFRCAVCGGRGECGGRRNDLRSPIPLDSLYERALGLKLGEFREACDRCHSILSRLHDVDERWCGLRDELIALQDSKVLVKSEPPEPVHLKLEDRSDSDDEPLARRCDNSPSAPLWDRDSKPEISKKPKPRLEIETVRVSKASKRSKTGAGSSSTPKKKPTKTKFACSDCPSVFGTQSRLDAHTVKHSKAENPYICEVCGASYKHKKACDIHVEMHKGISPWKCSECDKIFPSKGALSRHEAIHTGTPNYQCDLCGKSFIHTSSFKMHKLSHSGLKPHKCNKCGLSLMTRSHLKRHQRVHSGEKRHECSVCGKKFSERYNLYAHQKSHEDVQRKSKSYDCTVCEATFNRRNILDKHMETVHNCVNDTGPKRPRNTMTKIYKQNNNSSQSDSVIKAEPQVPIVDVKMSPSPPPLIKINNPSSVSESIPVDDQYPSLTSRDVVPPSENNVGGPSSQHNTWHGLVNYHLSNDYPLRMHGVDYAGYLNRQ